ncbi:uncharacterized protein DNG_07789 [Cephalotrichum gorgonifer]|uniref:Xylanolytic transcriptional activator regulatory domain-containing protein n=1 Tax=Cephalotrichum gorgonifer TaxID=2041049 RepID=A0AAE8N3Y8_9PEZI|nr:uncharacterized protein DNG_07789 [Cephalotrichum gorgonifer]
MDANSQERLRHLEHLVAVMRRQLTDRGAIPEEGAGAGPNGKSPAVRKETPRPPGMPETPGDLSGVYEPSPAGALVGEMRFVDAANWEAVLDDVTELTRELKTNDDDADDEDDFAGPSGPVLLSGSWPQMTVSEMIFDYMPPKPVTDRLIARFFLGKEPAWSMFHIPSFMRQYNEFWEAPHTFSMSWVGLLFIMIAHAALFCLRGDEEVPGNLGLPMEVCSIYRVRSAHALALDDFTKPGKWKVEAMILYFGIEYLRLSDAQRGTSILMTMTVRLAMHMGLHRDPTHYKDISIYECEMRRRLWTILTEIDLLVAFQFGLPANVQRRYFDTRIPRNILDEDFDETTTEWPPERPKTERTPALYTIVKSRIVVAFGDILSTVTSRHSPTYGEVLRLDKKLEEAHESIPPLLRMRSFSLSVTDPVELIMQRLWIELMYQKARIVLHRRYFTIARGDNRYRYSHFACIDAATMTLQHQFDIHNEMLPGGRLSRDRWFLSSLSTHDFLLANMMLALELSHLMRRDDPDRANNPEPIDKERLLSIISTSRSIWQSRCNESAEAAKAFKVLSRMLTISTGVQYDQVPQVGVRETMAPSQRPSYQFAHGMNFQDFGEQHSRQMFEQEAHMIWSTGGAQDLPVNVNMASGQWQNNPSSFAAPLAVPEALIEPGQGIDWSNWDTQILNASADSMEIPWTNFFN